MSKIPGVRAFSLLLCDFLFALAAIGQETTAGLQGTVKDPSGAGVANAQVVVTGTTPVGDKQTITSFRMELYPTCKVSRPERMDSP